MKVWMMSLGWVIGGIVAGAFIIGCYLGYNSGYVAYREEIYPKPWSDQCNACIKTKVSQAQFDCDQKFNKYPPPSNLEYTPVRLTFATMIRNSKWLFKKLPVFPGEANIYHKSLKYLQKGVSDT